MNDSAAIIRQIERRVLRRMRIRALIDWLGLALAAGAVVMGVLIVCGRFSASRRIPEYLAKLPLWVLPLGWVIAAAAGFAASKLRANRCRSHLHGKESDAAFAIDRALLLEDRIPTADSIIDRGEARGVVEAALLEDVSDRMSRVDPAAVIAYRWPHPGDALRCTAACTLAVSVMFGGLFLSRFLVGPRQGFAASVATADETVAMEVAGQALERESLEAEREAPANTETARLAKEQADVGRSLGRSKSQADALRKLSALEQRIRSRFDEIAKTRADEVVNLAERRFGSVLEPKPATGRKTTSDEDLRELPPGKRIEDAKQEESRRPGSADRENDPPVLGSESRQAAAQPAAAQPESKPRAGTPAPPTEPAATEPKSAPTPERPSEPSATGAAPQDAKPVPESGTTRPNDREKQQPDARDGSGSIQPPPGLLAEAAKASPALAGQLLKKAAELRANKLSEAEIRQLAQAAKQLSKDLEKIAATKEFQDALEQMARSVDPAQIEEVAKQLAKQEDLKRELTAAAKLINENREAKETIAGLAQKAAEVKEQFARSGFDSERRDSEDRANDRAENPDGSRDRSPDDPGTPGSENARNSGNGPGNGSPDQKGGAAGSSTRGGADSRPVAENRSRSFASGARERRDGGRDREGAASELRGREPEREGGVLRTNGKEEELFVRPKAGAVAARVPYSNAYPGYRREAERSVERSQVPARLRSLVRNYFDAINPDARRH